MQNLILLITVLGFVWLCGYANSYDPPSFNPAPLPSIAAVDTLAIFRAGTPAEYARARREASPGMQEAMARFD